MKEITWKPGSAQETKNLLYFALAIIVIYFAFTGGKSLLQKLGLLETEEEKKASEADKKLDTQSKDQDFRDPSQGWDVTKYNPWKEPFQKLTDYVNYKNSVQKKKGAQEYFITAPYNPKHATSQNAAKQIYDAIGTFSDSPEKITAVFNKLKDRSQVGILKDAFNDRYSKDLYDWLDDKLDTDRQKKIWTEIRTKVSKMPVGIYDKRNNNAIV